MLQRFLVIILLFFTISCGSSGGGGGGNGGGSAFDVNSITVTPSAGSYEYNLTTEGNESSSTLAIPFNIYPNLGTLSMEVVDSDNTQISFLNNNMKIKVIAPSDGLVKTVKYKVTLTYNNKSRVFEFTDVINFTSTPAPIDNVTVVPSDQVLGFNVALPTTSQNIQYTVTPNSQLTLELVQSNKALVSIDNNTVKIDYPDASAGDNVTVKYNLVLNYDNSTKKFPYDVTLEYIAPRDGSDPVTVPYEGSYEQVILLPNKSASVSYASNPYGKITLEPVNYGGVDVSFTNNVLTMSYPNAVAGDIKTVKYNLVATALGMSYTYPYTQTLKFIDTITPIDNIVVSPARGTYNYGLVLPHTTLVIPFTADPYGSFELQVVDAPNMLLSLNSNNVYITAFNVQNGDSNTAKFNLILHANGDVKTFDYVVNIFYNDFNFTPNEGSYSYTVDFDNFPVDTQYYTLDIPYTLEPIGNVALNVIESDGTIISLGNNKVTIAADNSTAEGTEKNVVYELTATVDNVTKINTYNVKIDYVQTSYSLSAPTSLAIIDKETFDLGMGIIATGATITTNTCVDGLSVAIVNDKVELTVAAGSIPTPSSTPCDVVFSLTGKEGTKSAVTQSKTISITTAPYLNFTPQYSTIELENSYTLFFNNATGVTFNGEGIQNCPDVAVSLSGSNGVTFEGAPSFNADCSATLTLTGTKTDYTPTTKEMPINLTKVFVPVISAAWHDNRAMKGNFVTMLDQTNAQPYNNGPVTLNISNPSNYDLTIVGWSGSSQGITVTKLSNTQIKVAVSDIAASTYTADNIDITINAVTPNRSREFVFNYFLDIEDGSSTKPYKIYDATKLQLIAKNTANLTKIYKLMNNVTLPSTNWTPIGNGTNPFTGTFDGQGYTVDNLVLTPGAGFNGLFGQVGSSLTSGTIVKNMTVKLQTNSMTNGGSYVGVITGYLKNATIDNCSAIISGALRGFDSTGGLVGYSSSSTISNSSVVGSVSSTNNGGGFAGFIDNTTIISSYAKNGSFTLGDSTSYFGGGFVGYAISSTIDQCFTTNVIVNGGAIDTSTLGGLLGYIKNGTVKNSYVTQYAPASLTTTDFGGGLVGSIEGTSVLINCYTTVSVTCSRNRCGGIVGVVNAPGTPMITNNAALSKFINLTTGTANTVSRISFSGGASLNYNYALTEMALYYNGSPVTLATTGIATDQGASYAKVNLPTLFNTTSNWSTVWDPAIWNFSGNGAYYLPILKSIPASVQPASKPPHL